MREKISNGCVERQIISGAIAVVESTDETRIKSLVELTRWVRLWKAVLEMDDQDVYLWDIGQDRIESVMERIGCCEVCAGIILKYAPDDLDFSDLYANSP
jgi:hypothetical protein